MAKFVVLSEGLQGRTYELQAEKASIGRLEDNSFQLSEASVSSHHCEVVLRGGEVLVRDLDSTNGTFIDGEQIKEGTLKPGQSLRLGQIELRLEIEGVAPVAPSAGVSAKKSLDPHSRPTQGVKLNELDKTTRPVALQADSSFKKQSNQINKVFVAIGIVLGLVIVFFIFMAFQKMKQE